MSKLVRLEIMDNKFLADDLVHLKGLTGVQSISLANNSILKFQDLAPLATIENLVQLDLSETKLSAHPEYRSRVFKMFKNLHILDNLDSEGKPFEYSDDSDPDDYVPSPSEEEPDDAQVLRAECVQDDKGGAKENETSKQVNGKRGELDGKVEQIAKKLEVKKVKEN